MKSEQTYWFHARDPEVGIGWSSPAAWQGWLALALFITAALGSAAFLVPQARAGVIVLANSNTVLTSTHNCTVSQMLRPQSLAAHKGHTLDHHRVPDPCASGCGETRRLSSFPCTG